MNSLKSTYINIFIYNHLYNVLEVPVEQLKVSFITFLSMQNYNKAGYHLISHKIKLQ